MSGDAGAKSPVATDPKRLLLIATIVVAPMLFLCYFLTNAEADASWADKLLWTLQLLVHANDIVFAALRLFLRSLCLLVFLRNRVSDDLVLYLYASHQNFP